MTKSKEQIKISKGKPLNLSKLHSFVRKWRPLFSSKNSRIFDSDEFPEGAWECGLEMDCGKSFEKAYPNINTTPNNTKELKVALTKVDNELILGNLIFSMWRYWNHWVMSEPEEKDWLHFDIMFARLEEMLKNREFNHY